jgi:hypothetical protein
MMTRKGPYVFNTDKIFFPDILHPWLVESMGTEPADMEEGLYI